MYELKLVRYYTSQRLNHTVNEVVISYVLRTRELLARPFHWPNSVAVVLALGRERGHASRAKENGDLIPPTKASRGGTYLVLSSLHLRGVRGVWPEKAVLSATHASWLDSTIPQHSLTLTIFQRTRINPR